MRDVVGGVVLKKVSGGADGIAELYAGERRGSWWGSYVRRRTRAFVGRSPDRSGRRCGKVAGKSRAGNYGGESRLEARADCGRASRRDNDGGVRLCAVGERAGPEDVVAQARGIGGP
jgi:hypothetical protein